MHWERIAVPAWFARYAVFIVVLTLQAVFLHIDARDAVAPFYPSGLDQIQYLTESYTARDVMAAQGVWNGLVAVLQQPHAQGIALQLEAALVYLVTSPSRLSALDVNILHLLLYMGVTAEAARRTAGLAASLASMALISSCVTLFHLGGVFDFRLDFAAMCLWGTLLALVVLGYGSAGARKPLTVTVACLAALLVMTRIIAAAYVVTFFGVLFLLEPMLRASPHNAGAVGRIGRRAFGIPLAAAGLAAAWFVLTNWTTVSTYYIGGHVDSEEKHLRAAEVGAVDLGRSVTFYLDSVLNDHAGIVFGRLVLVLAVVAGAGLLLAGRGRVSSVVQCPPFNTRWIACSLLVAFIGPYLALTSDEAKSVVVGDVLLPPLILVVICAFAQATSWTGKGSKAPRYVLLGITAALLAVGLRSEWNQFQLSSYETDQLGPATGSRLIENVGGYVENHLGGHATWATDGHLDFSPPLVTRLFYYEQHGKWLSLVSTLGDGSIQTVLTPEEILRQAGSSDVLIITRGGTPLYPYDQSIDAVKGPLFAMAIQQYRLMDEYQIGDRDVFVYVR